MFKKRNSIIINPCLTKPIQNRSVFISVFHQLFLALSISLISLFTFLVVTNFLEKKPLAQITKPPPTTSFPHIQVLGEEIQNPPNLPLQQGGEEATDQSQNSSPFLEGGLRGFLSSCRNCIRPRHLKDNAIDSKKIQNKSITSSDIKSNQINSRTIQDGSIQSVDLSSQIEVDQLDLNQLTVGQGSPSHFTLSSGDVYIQDNLEVDGDAFFDQKIYVRDSSSISVMTSSTLKTTTANISNILSNSHLRIKGRLPDEDYFQIDDFLKVFLNPSIGTYIGVDYQNIPEFSQIDGAGDLFIQDDLEVSGNIYGTLSGSFSPSGNLAMNNNLILNIGSSTTDFTSSGGLNLGGDLNVNNHFLVEAENGNVGIGTASPQFKLDVNGVVNATSLYVSGAPYIGSQWTTNSTDIYYSTGNVGIGTINPAQKLEVNGIIQAIGGTSVLWNTAYSWGNHALQNYITDGNTNWDNSYGFLTSYTETDPVFSAWNKSTGITITESQISNLQSYLTTETDPVFSSSQASNITASHIAILNNTSNTNTGDETQSSIQTKLGTATTTTSGYLTSTDWNIFNNKQPAGSYLTGTKVDSFNTRTGAVTLSSSDVTTALTFTPYNATNPAGYISSYTETDPIFSAWNRSSGISITESQISNLQDYLTGTKVDSFNTRTGAVTLSSIDVTTALTFTPYNSTNPNDYITDGNTLWNNEYGFITNLSSFTTDNLTQGTSNKYSQWATSGANISFSGGNVGIGTTSPLVKLKVVGDIETDNMVRATGWIIGTGSGLGVEMGVSSGVGYIYSYNRTSSAYGSLNMQNALSIAGSGGTVAVTNALTTGGTINGQTISSAANFTGSVTMAGALSVNNIDASFGSSAYTNLWLRDDESTSGAKRIHANSNLAGFLNGAGSWMSYWDNAGNQQNTGTITSGGLMNAANYLQINSKYAIDGTDSYLRLNQQNSFTSGIYTPYNFRADGTIYVGGTTYYINNGTSYLSALTTAGTITAPTFSGALSGNATTASILQTARTIDGVSFNGSSNISTTEWYHSGRDFVNGTIVTTSINYAVSSGDPWILEIKGNSYGSGTPFDIQYQGYIYSDTIINHGGYSNGTNISGMVVLNVGGYLTFWFPRQTYWQGFNVRVYTAYGTYAINKVTSITDGVKPSGTKEVALSANIRQSLHSSNYNSYTPTLTGTGASGTWGINITGNAATATNQSGGTVNATSVTASSWSSFNGGIYVHQNICIGNTPEGGSGQYMMRSPSTGYLYTLASSRRYKHDIIPLEANSSRIYDLKPVSFTFNSTGQRDFGLIAEETFDIIPELVGLDSLGRPDYVHYMGISTLILNEMIKNKPLLDNFSLKSEELENSLIVINNRLGQPAETEMQTTFEERFLASSADLAELTVTVNDNYNSLLTNIVDHEQRIQALEELIGGTTFSQPELSTVMQELDSHLQSTSTVGGYLFDLDGNLKVKKIEAEEITGSNQIKTKQIKFEEKEETICDENSEGIFYYNKQEKTFYGCDGTTWKKMQFAPE